MFGASVEVQASAERVWSVLIEPAFTQQWMAGATFESTWEVGADVLVHAYYNGAGFADRGSVLAFEPDRVLRYDLWSRVNRLPDRPENRAVITLVLAPIAGGTHLSVTHDFPNTLHAAEHVAHFWGVALHLIGRLAEGKPAIEGY